MALAIGKSVGAETDKKLAYEELTMKTEKKSLLSNLKTAKKAIVASNSTDAKPNVSSRAKAYVAVHGKVMGYVAARPKG